MVLFPEARRALELAASDPPVWEAGYDVPAARAEATAAGLAERFADRRRDQQLRVEILVERFKP